MCKFQLNGTLCLHEVRRICTRNAAATYLLSDMLLGVECGGAVVSYYWQIETRSRNQLFRDVSRRSEGEQPFTYAPPGKEITAVKTNADFGLAGEIQMQH